MTSYHSFTAALQKAQGPISVWPCREQTSEVNLGETNVPISMLRPTFTEVDRRYHHPDKAPIHFHDKKAQKGSLYALPHHEHRKHAPPPRSPLLTGSGLRNSST